MNRFAINEDASFELIGVHDLPLQQFEERSGQLLFWRKVTQISRYMSFRHKRESETHFIFALIDDTFLSTKFLLQQRTDDKLNENVRLLLSKFHIKSAMVTIISMARRDLITKEMMEAYTKGKEQIKQSVHDDLDYFLEKLQFQKIIYSPRNRLEMILSYFLPKLTAEEKQLVESKDELFMETFFEKDPNKILQKMKESESKTMYMKGACCRQTFAVDNSLFPTI